MDRWIGKVAIVTGASSGIGEAIAKSLVQAGVNVIAVARREDRLKTLSETLSGAKGSIYPIRCDVQKEKDILHVCKYAEDNLGGVDILVNNAGISVVESILEGRTEHFRTILDVNLLAPAIATREVVKSIRKRGGEGHIININSIAGRDATCIKLPSSLYQTSKFGLHAMTENVRAELRANKDKIKITGIYPGLVKTEIIEVCGADPEVFNRVPYVRGEDIADSVISALAAPENVEVKTVKLSPSKILPFVITTFFAAT